MKYYHVDVFSTKPMTGIGLTVIFPQEPLPDQKLLEIAQELSKDGYHKKEFMRR